MTDLNKRHSLKLFGGAGAGLAFASSPLFASLGPASKHDVSNFSDGQAMIEIDIINTNAVPEQSLLMSNKTDTLLEIECFRPGTVVFRDRMVELNALCALKPIRIEPDSSLSTTIEIWNILARPVQDYIWADEAVMRLSAETNVISVSAIVVDGQAIVYPQRKVAGLA